MESPSAKRGAGWLSAGRIAVAFLACAVHAAYYTAMPYYKIIREFPSGKGYADMVFLPHKKTDRPAMVIELKYDRSENTAINQIKEKRYAGAQSG